MTQENLKPVGRLAPSPTGAQHLGNARTYLFAWLSIRSRGGRLVLRIEDIDSPRVKPWAAEQAVEDLRWLGLDWDEGPDVGGSQPSYLQTERRDVYEEALTLLRANEQWLYPCTCSRKDIEEAASAPHEWIDGPVYPGTCSHWQQGDPVPSNSCWRFRALDCRISFDDLVVGRQQMNPQKSLGDFPVTRKTAGIAYQLAVVVDDIQMGVNEVLRGDDLLPSTFRQICIYKGLKTRLPWFAHVPLVVGADGRRLAKRHGDTRISLYREAGARPESIVGWAAWSAGLIDRWEEVSASELLDSFDIKQIVRKQALADESVHHRLMGNLTG